MSIKKQEFYEGAALHMLARHGGVAGMSYKPPFFRFNDGVRVMLKYSTKARSPWGFTFTELEQRLLEDDSDIRTVIALVCGDDGVAAFDYDEFQLIAGDSRGSIHVSCHRKHRQHYEVNGPEGSLTRKIAPSEWNRILNG